MSASLEAVDRPWAKATKSWRIGDVTLTRVVEWADAPVPASFLFQDADDELVKQHSWLSPTFATKDGSLFVVVQAFVIESRGRRIIVDTCIGNDKPRTVGIFNMLHTEFLSDLEAAGFPADTIDTVLCTHLHVDHVGWNTRWTGDAWVPTFPRARYLFGRVEWEHWTSDAAHLEDGDVVGDSVRPVVEAGLVDLVEMNHVLTDEVRLIPTPGHTPGHVSVMIESAGLTAVITGDLVHHPIQMSAPGLASNFDVDSPTARRTRRAFFASVEDQPIAVFGTHFAHPTAGWISKHGEAWRFTAPTQNALDPVNTRLSSDGLRWEPVE